MGMKLLDKLRSQPEWQSDDPVTRITAVRDLSDDAQDLLAEIARHDEDAAVRREAVGRVRDADILASILGTDSDEQVRVEAASAVRHLVLEAEVTATGERWLRSLTDERDLIAVARSARLETVSRAALSKLTDARALGAVARRANRIEIATEALARLDDPAELQSVVVKAEDKVIAVTAFERLASGQLSRETLETLAKRAKHKAVSRRAKAALAALDEALGTTEPNLHHVALCEQLEALTTANSFLRGRTALDSLLQRWAQLDDTVETALTARFATARRQVETRLAVLEAEQVAALKLKQQREDALTARRSLRERVEQLGEAEVAGQLQQLRAEWDAIPEMTAGALAEEITGLSRRFEASVAACEERHEQWMASQVSVGQLETLIGEMEQLAESGSETSGQERWPEAEKTWRDLMNDARSRVSAADLRTEARISALLKRREVVDARRRAGDIAAKTERARQSVENLTRLTRRCETIEGLVGSDKLQLPAAERQLRAVREALEQIGPLPSRREREAITRRLRHAHTTLVGRVRELRDFADWQRWANLGVQEDLCRQMETLAAASDADDVARRFRDIMTRWRQASQVQKGQGKELWERFKVAHDVVYPRFQAYRAAQTAKLEANLQLRLKIVEEAERLASSTDWLRTVHRITELQADWKAAGPFPRRQQKELWTRFRTACSTFFDRRKADLTHRKQEWAHNLELKEALCSRLEALAGTEDVAGAIQHVKEAQAEWKKIGPVRRTRSDGVWQRFKASCDTVFERARSAEREAVVDLAAARETICDELEALLPNGEPAGAPPEGLAAKVRDLQQRWRQSADAPQVLRRRLATRFGQGVSRVIDAYPGVFRGTELDPVRQLKRLEKICERVEVLIDREAVEVQHASPAEILATKWRDALASNLMGVRVDEATKRRAAVDEVNRLQAERRRIGQMPGEEGRHLAERFQHARDRVLQQAQPRNPPRSRRVVRPSRSSG